MLLTQSAIAIAISKNWRKAVRISAPLSWPLTTCSCQATRGSFSPTPCGPPLSSLWPGPRWARSSPCNSSCSSHPASRTWNTAEISGSVFLVFIRREKWRLPFWIWTIIGSSTRHMNDIASWYFLSQFTFAGEKAHQPLSCYGCGSKLWTSSCFRIVLDYYYEDVQQHETSYSNELINT